MEKRYLNVFLSLFIVVLQIDTILTDALQLTQDNYQDVLSKNKLVFINFYADWCMFSQQLAPIFHQTADIIHEEYPDVKLGRVDCENQQQIALENMISKYPTMKLFKNGKAMRKEYRGARSVDAFTTFIKQNLKVSVVDVNNKNDLHINEKKNTIVAYLEGKNDAYQNFNKIADEMNEIADFIAVLGDASAQERHMGETIIFKPKKTSGESEAALTVALNNYEQLKQWVNDKANPLVREITFENGEELTEEGLPFLILFHKPDDIISIQRFKNAVARELLSERGRVNFLTADGTTFAHPLHHLGKSIHDLPLIAIDSFRHMYMFKRFDNIDVSGKLKQFINDLHSGKLHQDFHNPPPDTVVETPNEAVEIHQEVPKEATQEGGDIQIKYDPASQEKKTEGGSGSGQAPPPETVFNKLAPSENRYTLLHWRDYSGEWRDEL
ncbi:endoplasmic reticulum resident protein 44 isoform X2 [Hydra vulgaris]|uniref:Endoplasmic reticulum resident protein 44 isoform X2 n=1 Tax=Hydra vulgaris TaxID=6087 RepID=A0ABM4C176_HYDVU